MTSSRAGPEHFSIKFSRSWEDMIEIQSDVVVEILTANHDGDATREEPEALARTAGVEIVDPDSRKEQDRWQRQTST